MGFIKFIPALWAVIWSFWAIRFVLKKESQFRWGLGRRADFVPLWLGSSLFIVSSIYALFWAVVTTGMDLGYWGPSSGPATALARVNQGLGLVLLDAFLATGFIFFAITSFRVTVQEKLSPTGRLVASVLTLGALSIAGLATYQVARAIAQASSKTSPH